MIYIHAVHSATHWVSRQLLQLDYTLFRHRKFVAPETVPPCWPWPFFCLLFMLMMLFFIFVDRRGMQQQREGEEKRKIHTLILIKLLFCVCVCFCLLNKVNFGCSRVPPQQFPHISLHSCFNAADTYMHAYYVYVCVLQRIIKSLANLRDCCKLCSPFWVIPKQLCVC